ncbi:hypothetical protein FACS189413_04430 [Bacteroidia bacterium]|nr:hypothetical protein FACS189413_04430 [Bacteroidia bacterium]
MLSASEQKQVAAAIREAETMTSGEIRVHIAQHCKNNVMESAVDHFNRLKMDQTAHRNGTLIFVAIKDKKVAILGDTGIDAVVPSDFWDNTLNLMRSHFRNNALTEGLYKGIEQVGLLLKQYFPYQSDDINELPDDISFS